jgi:hypothetical protein
MKRINSIKFLFAITTAFSLVSCDKSFVETNQNPYAFTTMEPSILLSSAQRRVSAGSWEVEATIVQQFVNAYNGGATVGFQFNSLIGAETYNQTRWNQMYNAPDGTVRLLDRALELAKGDPGKANLLQMIRILRAMNYMILVDTYGNVPYTEANKAYTGTAVSILTPKYDKGADIYTDLYKELKEARAALTATNTPGVNTGAAVNTDIFYGTSLTSTSAAVQIPKWQRLAGSLMLRLGMRYSKLNTTTAQTIVADAVSGPGVMTSIADDAYVPFNSNDVNPLNNGPRVTNPFNYYLYEPFVNQLKSTRDPRGKYIAAYYQSPNSIGNAPQDTVLANQFGFPVGYDNNSVALKSDFKGVAQSGQGFRYSQLNYNVFGSATAPIFVCTYAQTSLLLAEARLRNWITSGPTATTLYENGIRASMDEYRLYPNAVAIPDLNYQSYKRQAAVALSLGNVDFAGDLAKINTQYWVVSLGNTAETFANFRRTGLPALTPNPFGTPLPASTGGFARRVPYPSIERSANAANYQASIANLGGTDDVTRRVFWDIP